MGKPLEGIAVLLSALQRDPGSRDRLSRRIWERYYARLTVFVRGCGVHPDEVEDVVQDTMEKVVRGIEGYDPARGFSTWVYTIAKNTCRDRARRQRARPPARPLSGEQGGVEPFHSLTPEKEFLHGETERAVSRFLAEEGPETRQIAFLRFSQSLRYAEIAGIMGIPVGTVKSRVHEIRRRLGLRLEEENGDGRTQRASAF
jgi:RNA polymerase sigma factor (sigma-70 family)